MQWYKWIPSGDSQGIAVTPEACDSEGGGLCSNPLTLLEVLFILNMCVWGGLARMSFRSVGRLLEEGRKGLPLDVQIQKKTG